ncbi:MAG: peptide-methionine (S)-S-oxide reductase MsrA [Ferruginibacter sp.]
MKIILSQVIAIAGLLILTSSCNANKAKVMNETKETMDTSNAKLDTATFGTGCFWCTEAIFQQLEGVVKVTSGYSGGQTNNPNYKEVCSGTTGHAECLNIVYDPSKISFDELLEVFWQTHDPTTLNRQGNDVGTQYRSVVFYHNDEQKAKTEKYKTELDKSGAWNNPIVTTLEPFTKFYPAEDYHQNYYLNNPEQGYCQFVVRPKVEKFEKVFKNKLKKH